MVSSIESQGRRSDIGFALSVYRALTSLARPAAGLILRLRERRGKEDPARRGRAAGRAGRLAARGHAGLVSRRERRRNQRDSAAHRGSDGGAARLAGAVHDGHGDFRAAGCGPAAGGRDAPVCAARCRRVRRPSSSTTGARAWLSSRSRRSGPICVFESHARGIPLALVNARMSQSSFERWQRRPRLRDPLFSRFDLVLAQSETLARQFSELGAPRSLAAGNLKIDAPPPPVNDADLQRLEAALGRTAGSRGGEHARRRGGHHRVGASHSGWRAPRAS